MEIIADACTIILLAKSSVLESFAKNSKVNITEEVKEEVLKGKPKMFLDALLLERLLKERIIEAVKTDKTLTKKLMKDFNMGEGEASIITRGIKEGSIIATDNRQGRKVAQINNLPIIGSIEIIVNLYQKNKIDQDKATEALKILQRVGWFEQYLIEKAKEDIK